MTQNDETFTSQSVTQCLETKLQLTLTLYSRELTVLIGHFFIDKQANSLLANDSDAFYRDNLGYGVSLYCDKAEAHTLNPAIW